MPLKRSTARDTGSTRSDWGADGGLLSLRWSGRISVTRRIMAVNIFALVILAASFFYLDSYRTRLTARWRLESQTQAVLIAQAINDAPYFASAQGTMDRFAQASAARVRVVDAAGKTVIDAWPSPLPNYGYDDPAAESWNIKTARLLDRGIDTIVFAPNLKPFADTLPSRAPSAPSTDVTFAPDRTPMISAIAPTKNGYVLTTENAREITQTVRDERLRLVLIIVAVTLVSVLLSLFLARTIVQPLRRLARAAVRVRLGRDREVTVPRLPTRSDEIGMLARALSDMSLALRARIDATEAFAADVTHELKNPLASLRSAVDSLALVQATELRAQLIEIIRGDVRRLDRLITDIAELSRLDAQMSRTPFQPVDLGALLNTVATHQRPRAAELNVSIDVTSPVSGGVTALGDSAQLERVIYNLIDNALSFAPAGGHIRMGAYRRDGNCVLWIEDDGPGVSELQRDAIFQRFHSARPEAHAFGKHAGLGLAIAKTVIEAHHGSISVMDHADGSSGARFVVTLPAERRSA